MTRLVAAAALCLSFTAAAQDSGRTDGPEGSEIGKGGYDKPGNGRFSLALDWGASIILTPGPLDGSNPNAPLYLGGTVSFWSTDWFVLDAHASHAFNSRRTNVLLGPRLRTSTWPVSGSIGLRAGMIHDPMAGVRFALSPVIGLDMMFRRHLMLGLEAAYDLPVAGSGSNVRLGLNIGWRF